MNFNKKNTLIILIAGKARSGKGEVASYLKDYFLKKEKKVILSPYTKYLKRYIVEVTGKEFNDEDKPRDLLQKLSSDLIKKKLSNPNFFINRQLEDLSFYSYFMDVVIIPDVRFEEEINKVKENFTNVVTIGVKRKNYLSILTKEQQEDITELALDNYCNYDYKIENTSLEKLQLDVLKIIKNLEKEGRIWIKS